MYSHITFGLKYKAQVSVKQEHRAKHMYGNVSTQMKLTYQFWVDSCTFRTLEYAGHRPCFKFAKIDNLNALKTQELTYHFWVDSGTFRVLEYAAHRPW